MRWVSSISSDPDCEHAVRIACAEISSELGTERPDVLFLFVSPVHRDHYSTIQSWVSDELKPRNIVGCTAQGIVGRGLEIEVGPGISITAAILPDTAVEPRHVSFEDIPDADASPDMWKQYLGLEQAEHIVLMADPYSVHIEDFLRGLDYTFPEVLKVGGLASAAGQPGENALFINGRTHNHGAVVLAFSGNLVMDAVVAQGCRPVGDVATVTSAKGNMVQTLNGKPAFEFVQEVQAGLGEYDRKLFKSAVFLGITNDPFITDPEEGDYLIRNLIGIDYQSGSIILAGIAEEGALVQVHLRDRKSSRLDLERLLDGYAASGRTTSCEGALLFACLGRGQYLYGATNHDCDMISDKLGAMPIGGFFCAGEIGPVGSATYIHGYTSSIGVFRARE